MKHLIDTRLSAIVTTAMEYKMAADNTKKVTKSVGVPIKGNHVVQPSLSGNLIAVGCKLPHGIHMDIRRHGHPTQRVTLKGTNSLQTGLIKLSTIGGYAVTENVPEEFFTQWLKDNSEHPAVKNNLIFHHEQVASVHAMGQEIEGDIKTGLDPIDPNKKVIDPKTGRVAIETRRDDD
jgi:hypothetical protein